MGKKGGGIRKRILEYEQANEPVEPEPSEPGSSSYTRSIRKRVGALAPSSSSSSATVPSDPMVGKLLRDWAKGKLSAVQVQELAFAAMPKSEQKLEGLASAGSWGKHPQNVHRSLVSYFGRPAGSPEMVWVDIPTKNGMTPHPFFLPHMWFSSLAEHDPDLFKKAVTGPPGQCQDFWDNMSDTPFMEHHPHLEHDRLAHTIPLGFYGDAGAYSDNNSLYVFTWNSLMGSGQTMAKRFLCTCIKKSDMVAGTEEAMFEVLSWSFNALLSGIWPATDWAGRPCTHGNPGKYLVAGGLRGCLTQVRGDWEFYCSVFQLPKWSEAANMCFLCGASSNGPLAFANCSREAPWRATRKTHESYSAALAASGKQLPILLRNIHGLRLECIMIDVLHTVDLGFTAHVVGNVFNECLINRVFGGRNIRDNLARLNRELAEWYSKNKVKSKLDGQLTLERIRSQTNPWPKLKSKAAAGRHLAPFCHYLAVTFLKDRRIQALTQLLCEFYRLLDSQGMFLDPDARARFPLLGQRMCGLFAQLSGEALANGHRRWKMTPKVHLTLHLCEWQAPSVGNPKAFWVYADEDFVGSMIEVAEACHSKTVAATAMLKWSHLFFSIDP